MLSKTQAPNPYYISAYQGRYVGKWCKGEWCGMKFIRKYADIPIKFVFAFSNRSTTLSTSACFALPLEEWESIAILASASTKVSKDFAELAAIPANSAEVGFWFNPKK